MKELHKSEYIRVYLTDSGNLIIEVPQFGRWRLTRTDTNDFARELKNAIGEQASAGAVVPAPWLNRLADCDDFHLKQAPATSLQPKERHVTQRIGCSRCLTRITLDSLSSALPTDWKVIDGHYVCPRCVRASR